MFVRIRQVRQGPLFWAFTLNRFGKMGRYIEEYGFQVLNSDGRARLALAEKN